MLIEDIQATTEQRAELVPRREVLDMQLSTMAHQNVCKSSITAQDDLARAFLSDLVVELQQYLMDKLTGASNESMHISNELD